MLPGVAGVLVVLSVLYSFGLAGIGQAVGAVSRPFCSFLCWPCWRFCWPARNVIKHYNLEYALGPWWSG